MWKYLLMVLLMTVAVNAVVIPVTNMTIGVHNATTFNTTINATQLNLSNSLNGSYIFPMMNYTHIGQDQGDISNKTVSVSLPAGTNLTLQTKYYNWSNLSINTTRDLILWAGFDDANNRSFSVYNSIPGSSAISLGSGVTNLNLSTSTAFCAEDQCMNVHSSSNGKVSLNSNNFSLDDFSIGFFVYDETGGSDTGGFMSLGATVNVEHMFLRYNTANHIAVSVNNTVCQNVGKFISGQLQFIVATFNDTNITIYQNGTQVGMCPRTYNMTRPINMTTFGSNVNGNTLYEAWHDNFMIFNRSLTLAEIREINLTRTRYSAYSPVCDVSINSSGCFTTRSTNHSLTKAVFTTNDVTITPLLYNLTDTIQNITQASPPIIDEYNCTRNPKRPAVTSDMVLYYDFTECSFLNVTQNSTNVSTLTFIVTTTPQDHYNNLSNISVIRLANLSITYTSLSVGGWDVYLNNASIGSITTSNTSPVLFKVMQSYLVDGWQNISYVPQIATTGTITKTEINYTYKNVTKVIDYSNSRNNGTAVGSPFWNSTGGFLGDGAFEFDGVNDYLVSKNNVTNTSLNYTISFFLRLNSTGKIHALYEERISSNAINVFVNDADNLFIQTWNSTGGVTNSGGTVTLTKGKWYFIVARHFPINSTSSNISIFVNGVFRSSAATAGQPVDVNQVTRFGTDVLISARFLNGSMSDLFIQNVSLTDTQVIQLYNNYTTCLNPTNIQIIIGNATICTGTYYLNSSGDVFGSGALVVSGSNTILNGNGSTFIGNNSGAGISSTSWSNILIKNLTLINYNRSIFLQNGQNLTIQDNTILNSSIAGVILRNVNYSVIDNNTILNKSTSTAITIDVNPSTSQSFYNTINNNIISGTYGSIALNGNTSYTLVINNNIVNSTYLSHCIQTYGTSDYNNFTNNNLSDCGWNGIDISSSYNIINHNRINNPHHNAIDLYANSVNGDAGDSVASANNNIISNNYLYNSSGGSGFNSPIPILVISSKNTQIINNIINYSYNGFGIGVYGNSSVFFNNTIENNSIYNGKYGIFMDTNNTLGMNYFYNISTYLYRIKNILSNSINISVNNFTNALIYNLTATCNGSNKTLRYNTGTVNLTLKSSEVCYVVDNVSIIEGISIPTDIYLGNFPFIVSGDDTKTIITNNLSDAINVSVYLNYSTQPRYLFSRSVNSTTHDLISRNAWTWNGSHINKTLEISPGITDISYEIIPAEANYTLTANKDLFGANFILNGSGTFNLKSNITNSSNRTYQGVDSSNKARLIISNEGGFR